MTSYNMICDNMLYLIYFNSILFDIMYYRITYSYIEE